MMPLGIRCSAVFTPLMTSVCPALWPPWKRTTPCALSVSQSTSLPLPSSPHWVPTTTTLRPVVEGFMLCLDCCGFGGRDRAGRPAAWPGAHRRGGAQRIGQAGSSERLDHPLPAGLDELAVAVKFVDLVGVARQGADHG